MKETVPHGVRHGAISLFPTVWQILKSGAANPQNGGVKMAASLWLVRLLVLEHFLHLVQHAERVVVLLLNNIIEESR